MINYNNYNKNNIIQFTRHFSPTQNYIVLEPEFAWRVIIIISFLMLIVVIISLESKSMNDRWGIMNNSIGKWGEIIRNNVDAVVARHFRWIKRNSDWPNRTMLVSDKTLWRDFAIRFGHLVISLSEFEIYFNSTINISFLSFLLCCVIVSQIIWLVLGLLFFYFVITNHHHHNIIIRIIIIN